MTIMFKIALLVLAPAILYSQERNVNNWRISFAAMAAMPIGKFSKNIPEKSLIKNTDGSYSFNFFDKKGSGAAIPGYATTLQISLSLSKKFSTSLGIHYSQNSVNVKKTENYLDLTLSKDLGSKLEHQLLQADYKLIAGLLGTMYQFHRGGFDVLISPQFGYARMAFPEYIFNQFWYKDGSANPPIQSYNYFHRGDKNDLYNFIYGLQAKIVRPIGRIFRVGLQAEFLAANFSYHLTLQSPGGNPFNRDDIINYRNLNAGLLFGISF